MIFWIILSFFLTTILGQNISETVKSSKQKIDFKGKNPKVRGKNYGGTGCPANSVSISLNADSTAMTVIFSNFIASSGPNVNRNEASKRCTIDIDLDYPPNMSYSVAYMIYRGYVSVPPEITATHSSIYDFRPQNEKSELSTSFNSYNNDYLIKIDIPPSERGWSTCGSNLKGRIRTSIKLNGDLKKDGLITVDSLDQSTTITQVYSLDWKYC